MPSFETDVVLRALIVDKVPARVGPDFMGPDACADLAATLNVDKYQLWGSICNLRLEGRVQDVRVPDDSRLTALFPTYKGECYFRRSSRKQPYPRKRRLGAASVPA